MFDPQSWFCSAQLASDCNASRRSPRHHWVQPIHR